MKSVTASEARVRFGQLLERIAHGEEVVITKHGRPVARLVPESRRNLESVRSAVAGIFELRRQIHEQNQGKFRLTAAEIKGWIGKGRC